MGKYVAFLDILGFKNKLKQLGHTAAKQYISDFLSTVHKEWKLLQPKLVEGCIVSDSFIMYTRNTTKSALEELLTVIDRICKKEFSDNKILIRGAIAKGEFEMMPTMELSNLSKHLMVGQAYVDAYMLEDTVKVAGVLLTEDVNSDICEMDSTIECIEEKTSGKSNYIMRYLDYEYLLKPENMQEYVNIAIESKWLPHYYNTLYCAIKSDKNGKKASEFFENIIANIGDPSEEWREIDNFIENAFAEGVINEFKKRFLKYLRGEIVIHKRLQKITNSRLNNKERVLEFIAERDDFTISEISSALGVSHSTVARIIHSLTNEGIIEKTNAYVSVEKTTKRSVSKYSIK